MPLDYFVNALVTLVVTVDPVGLVPAFLAVTHGVPAPARQSVVDKGLPDRGRHPRRHRPRRRMAARAARDLLAGLPHRRRPAAALGGLRDGVRRCASSGSRSRPRRRSRSACAMSAAFPLAIPLMAGPGAITATLLLSAQTQGRPLALALSDRRGRDRDLRLRTPSCVLAGQIGRRARRSPATSYCPACSVSLLAALAVQFDDRRRALGHRRSCSTRRAARARRLEAGDEARQRAARSRRAAASPRPARTARAARPRAPAPRASSPAGGHPLAVAAHRRAPWRRNASRRDR